MLMLLFFLFLTGIEGNFRQRSPTNCLSAPQFVKKAGGGGLAESTISPGVILYVRGSPTGCLACSSGLNKGIRWPKRRARGCVVPRKMSKVHCPPSPVSSANPTFSSDVSDPFLHGAFAVQYVAWRTLPLELYHSADQHQQAQRKHTGDDDGDCFHHVGLVVQLDHHIWVAVITLRPGRVDGPQLTAHEVLEDGTWIAWLHSEELVVKLPVFLPLVEVGEPCGKEPREDENCNYAVVKISRLKSPDTSSHG